MTIERAPGFPEEAVKLFAALTRCTDGHSTAHVLEASANLLAATILLHAREQKLSVPDVVRYAGAIGANMAASVIAQWNAEIGGASVAKTEGSHAT